MARNVDRYKELLANCDRTRRNDLDGRGNLSEEALVEFTRFFLKICIDQVDFMEKLVQPNELRPRIQLWVEEQVRFKRINQKAGLLLDAILYRGGRCLAERWRKYLASAHDVVVTLSHN